MNRDRKELVLNTDSVSFAGMVIVCSFACLSLSVDVYRWSHGKWAELPSPPEGFFAWFTFALGILAMAWFVAAFRDPAIRLLRIACGLNLLAMLMKGALFVLKPESFLWAFVMYARPAVGFAALVAIGVYLVSWFKSIVVHG